MIQTRVKHLAPRLFWLEMLCFCRYDELAESVEDYVLDVLKDQLNRRQPMDNVSRNLLRLLTATCGFKEGRLMAVQRLEMWLQNPKVSNRRPSTTWISSKQRSNVIITARTLVC